MSVLGKKEDNEGGGGKEPMRELGMGRERETKEKKKGEMGGG